MIMRQADTGRHVKMSLLFHGVGSDHSGYLKPIKPAGMWLSDRQGGVKDVERKCQKQQAN